MAALNDCTKIKDPTDRLDCIEKNVVQVNASLEAVARELRDQVKKLGASIDSLANAVMPRLEALEKAGKAALNNGDVVTISSFDPTKGEDRQQCLTWMDNMASPRTQACGGGAVYAQGWKLHK